MLALTNEMPWMWAALLVLVVLPAFLACYYVLCLRSYASPASSPAQSADADANDKAANAEEDGVSRDADANDKAADAEEDGVSRDADGDGEGDGEAAGEAAGVGDGASDVQPPATDTQARGHMHLHGQHRCGSVRTPAADRVRHSCRDCTTYIRRTRTIYSPQAPAGYGASIKSPSMSSDST